MALVLCQQCLSWVEPITDQCPQCDYPIDPRLADPTLEELGATIGSLIAVVGPVRIARTALPDRGHLYATTGGLFFAPQSSERIRVVPVRRHSRSLRSICRTALQVPSVILSNRLSFPWRPARPRTRLEISTHELPVLTPNDGDRLPELLMDNPGAFFFARRSVRTIRRTFAGWCLLRPNNLALRLKPLGDRAVFHQCMSAFADELLEAVYR